MSFNTMQALEIAEAEARGYSYATIKRIANAKNEREIWNIKEEVRLCIRTKERKAKTLRRNMEMDYV